MWETQYQHPMPTETQFRKYWHCSVPRSGVPFKIKKASSRRTKLSIGNFVPHQSKWFLEFRILFLKNKLDLHNGMSVSWSYPWHLVHFCEKKSCHPYLFSSFCLSFYFCYLGSFCIFFSGLIFFLLRQLIFESCASPSDNLISLIYSMPVFSANLFGLFFYSISQFFFVISGYRRGNQWRKNWTHWETDSGHHFGPKKSRKTPQCYFEQTQSLYWEFIHLPGRFRGKTQFLCSVP